MKPPQKCEIMEPQSVKRLTAAVVTRMQDFSSNKPEFEGANAIRNTEVWAAGEEILSSLPNDLTRLIYLTSIRDYNSGFYRHPVLSRQFDPTGAHRVFEAWHQQVFARLLTISVRKYVEELEGYIRYSRAERQPFITTWKALQAYRAAIPLKAPRHACEIFFLNVKTALSILEHANRQPS